MWTEWSRCIYCSDKPSSKTRVREQLSGARGCAPLRENATCTLRPCDTLSTNDSHSTLSRATKTLTTLGPTTTSVFVVLVDDGVPLSAQLVAYIVGGVACLCVIVGIVVAACVWRRRQRMRYLSHIDADAALPPLASLDTHNGGASTTHAAGNIKLRSSSANDIAIIDGGAQPRYDRAPSLGYDAVEPVDELTPQY